MAKTCNICGHIVLVDATTCSHVYHVQRPSTGSRNNWNEKEAGRGKTKYLRSEEVINMCSGEMKGKWISRIHKNLQSQPTTPVQQTSEIQSSTSKLLGSKKGASVGHTADKRKGPEDPAPSGRCTAKSNRTKVVGDASEHPITENTKKPKRDNDLHRLLFLPKGLRDGAELAYCAQGQEMILKGYKQGNGIVCSHCNTEVSPSKFEAHAGYGFKRQPYRHIYTTIKGRFITLHEISQRLACGESIHSEDMNAVSGDRGDERSHVFNPGKKGVVKKCSKCGETNNSARDNVGKMKRKRSVVREEQLQSSHVGSRAGQSSQSRGGQVSEGLGNEPLKRKCKKAMEARGKALI